jgi:OOP family OmpA-OmpF porin
MRKHATATAIALSAVVTLMAAPAARAQAYLGAGVGGSHIDINCAGTTSCDKTDTGGRLFGGYKVLPNLGVEAIYFDFGKAKTTGPGAVSGDMKVTGLGAGVAFFGEFAPSWLGVVRLGAASTKSDISGTLGTFTSADNKTKANPYIGVGVSYLVSPNLAVDAALDFSRVKYGSESANVRLLSVGLTYGF